MSKKFPVNELHQMLKKSLKEAKARDELLLGSYDGQYDKLEQSLAWIKSEKEQNKLRPKEERNYYNRLIREEIREKADTLGKQVGVVKLGPNTYWKDKSPVTKEQLERMKMANDEDFEMFDDIVMRAGGFHQFKRKYPTVLSDIAHDYNIPVDKYLEWKQDKEILEYEQKESARLQKAQAQTKVARQTKKVKKTISDIDELLKEEKKKK